MVHRQLGHVDPAMDVASAWLCERPLERSACPVAEKYAEGLA
jgi:hypothetical protein